MFETDKLAEPLAQKMEESCEQPRGCWPAGLTASRGSRWGGGGVDRDAGTRCDNSSTHWWLDHTCGRCHRLVEFWLRAEIFLDWRINKKKKKTEKERKHLLNHTELAVEPSAHSTCLIAFLLYPRLSPPLYARTLRPFCSESRFSLSKWPECFGAGELTPDVYTGAWTGPPTPTHPRQRQLLILPWFWLEGSLLQSMPYISEQHSEIDGPR